MIVSTKRIEANRLNAQKSTGPKTPEGKAKSCLNAAKHNDLARQVLVQGHKISESSEEFEALSREYFNHLAPVGPLEEMLVDKIVTTLWRLRRVRTAESAEIARNVDLSWWNRNHETDPATVWSEWRILGDPTLKMRNSAIGNRLFVNWLSELYDKVQRDGELTQQALDEFNAKLGVKADLLSLRIKRYWERLLKFPDNLEPAALRERNKGEMLDFLLTEKDQAAHGMDQCRARESKMEEASHSASVLFPAHILDKILRYEAALEKQLSNAMAQLERLQSRRLAQNPQPVEASEPSSEDEEVEMTKRTHFENEQNSIKSTETTIA